MLFKSAESLSVLAYSLFYLIYIHLNLTSEMRKLHVWKTKEDGVYQAVMAPLTFGKLLWTYLRMLCFDLHAVLGFFPHH